MPKSIAALLLSLALATQAVQAEGYDPAAGAITTGFYRVTIQTKTFERCYPESSELPSAATDLGECKVVKRVEEGEQFEVVQSCKIDEDTLTIRMSGIARPGYVKAKTEFVDVPEEMREFFKDAFTSEARRMRDCTADELSKARLDAAKVKKPADKN